MRSVSSAISSYLQARAGVDVRQFLWIVAKNRSSGADEAVGFWNDVYDTTATVLDGLTGAEVSRTYVGAGTLISGGAIPLTSDLTVRSVQINLSQVSQEVAQAIRGYDPRLARVEIHIGLLDLRSKLLVAPPPAAFVGQVNGLVIPTMPAGQSGSVQMTAVSQTIELTRTNPAKKSDAWQSRRSGDRFRQYQSTAGLWDIAWGEKRDRIR